MDRVKVEVVASGVRIDHSKPILAQVGCLDADYDAWTHEAVDGSPRLFGPALLEACTITPWYVVPIFWVPISAICMLVSVQVFSHSFAGVLWRSLVGLAAWFGIEYVLHRCIFHYIPKCRWGITLHFLFHGIHHKFPRDPGRLVFPVLPAAAITALLASLLKIILPFSEVLPIMSGVLVGYVMYDVTHYMLHHMDTKTHAWLDPLRSAHMDHHYRDHSGGFGITTPFFDLVCGTSLHQTGPQSKACAKNVLSSIVQQNCKCCECYSSPHTRVTASPPIGKSSR